MIVNDRVKFQVTEKVGDVEKHYVVEIPMTYLSAENIQGTIGLLKLLGYTPNVNTIQEKEKDNRKGTEETNA